jgi:hypothetical protein
VFGQASAPLGRADQGVHRGFHEVEPELQQHEASVGDRKGQSQGTMVMSRLRAACQGTGEWGMGTGPEWSPE